MPEKLIEFWKRCDLAGPDLAHPDDLVLLKREGTELIQNIPEDLNSFLQGPQFADPRLHLKLVPQPYAGDLGNARIVVLLLNPGLGYTDYWGEMNKTGFRERLEKNLLQSFDDSVESKTRKLEFR